MNYYYANSRYPQRVQRRMPAPVQTNPFEAPRLEKVVIADSFMTEQCADACRLAAMAQILSANPLKYGMTPKEYAYCLMKQGKIPNKHFTVDDDRIVEYTPANERKKEVVFIPDEDPQFPPAIESHFYNPYTQEEYKTVIYSKEGVKTVNNDMEAVH